MKHTKVYIDLLNPQTTFRQYKKEKKILLYTEQKRNARQFQRGI